jgi:chromosome segregation ATPase
MQRKYIAVAAVILLGGWLWVDAAPLGAQQTASGNDVLPALLQEVRGLRAAMEQMATAGTQAQLLVGRLQLQEGRIATMIRRLENVRDSLATARREYDQMRGAMQMLDKPDAPGQVPQDDKDNILAGFKNQLAAAKGNIDRLTAEEAELTADIGNEQARWIEINGRLDELERTLAKR